jgi:ribonucleoside-diphosphate reductase alpha chain
MCGAGFGFDVTRESISQLPAVPATMIAHPELHVIPDSREGWADSIKILMDGLYNGQIIFFDYSQIRKKGERLKTMGGRASGPEPLKELHLFILETFMNADGKLSSLDCHDICNKIAEIVVVGGVRRSSEISLSDPEDEVMRKAKIWPFPLHRAMANNSAVYTKKPTHEEFQKEWKELELSGTGERGIFNLEVARNTAPERRNANLIRGLNPCAEIMLRSRQMCNLSEVVISANDTLESLAHKVKVATVIGVIQSTFTHFPYLRQEWKDNCEEERLLGVSLTGIMDAPQLVTAENLQYLKQTSIAAAAEMSKTLGVNMPTAITCVKPSGTVSQLVNSASGMHPRYAKRYVRRYRISAMDPLFKMMTSQGFEFTPENGQDHATAQTWVVEFPVVAPETAVCREAVSAIDQLELYKTLQENWSEHNSSLTVYVPDGEWDKVGQWVWNHWGIIKGVSFLPFDSGHYKQAPYEVVNDDTWNRLVAQQKPIDYSQLNQFERVDNTSGAKTLACTGDRCELV